MTLMIDGGVISSMLIAAAGVIGWLYTQTQARSKSQRAELRHRRLLDLERGRWCRQLEQELSDLNLDLPIKRAELIDAEKEEW